MVRIRIRRSERGVAVLISFDTRSDEFESNYERNKFFRNLYGWNQVIKKSPEQQYEYHREGILDTVPHVKVGNSMFIVPSDELKKMMEFFDEWHKKVTTQMFKVMLSSEQLKMLERSKNKTFEDEE